MTNRSLLVAALLTLAACGGDDASPETQPAGSQPAPTTQHQAAPQTGPNTPQAIDAQAPPPTVDAQAFPPSEVKRMSYRECMNTPGAQSEAERERACMTLPDAPK